MHNQGLSRQAAKQNRTLELEITLAPRTRSGVPDEGGSRGFTSTYRQRDTQHEFDTPRTTTTQRAAVHFSRSDTSNRCQKRTRVPVTGRSKCHNHIYTSSERLANAPILWNWWNCSDTGEFPGTRWLVSCGNPLDQRQLSTRISQCDAEESWTENCDPRVEQTESH